MFFQLEFVWLNTVFFLFEKSSKILGDPSRPSGMFLP